MTVKPILFSAPMVRAILREIHRPGTGKTQTRRVLNPQPAEWQAQVIDITAPTFDEDVGGWGQWVTEWSSPCPEMPMGEPNREVWRPLRGLRFAVGDVLWVRETCSAVEAHDGLDCVRYDADQIWRPIPNNADAAEQWLDLHHYRKQRGASVPSIHMPRWASRLTLVVTDVRVERLQDISEADAKAEGCGLYVPGHGFITYDELAGDPGYSNFLAPRMGFEAIWTEINGPKSWAENPWVVAVSFIPHAMNVDAFLAQKEAA